MELEHGARNTFYAVYANRLCLADVQTIWQNVRSNRDFEGTCFPAKQNKQTTFYRSMKPADPQITRADETGTFEEEFPGQVRVTIHHKKNCGYKPVMTHIVTAKCTWCEMIKENNLKMCLSQLPGVCSNIYPIERFLHEHRKSFRVCLGFFYYVM